MNDVDSTPAPPPPASGITVGVRVRPFNERERRYDAKNVIIMNSIEEMGTVRVMVVKKGVVSEHERPKEFQFDFSFWSHDDAKASSPFVGQSAIFHALGIPVIQNVLEGFNSSLLAYGQTGSGKTYSMQGFAGEEGLTPRVSQHLFDCVAETIEDPRSSFTRAEVECSYLEIYNEQVVDLLKEPASNASFGGALKVRQHPSRGVFVEGLQAMRVTSYGEVAALLAAGDKRRRVASTNMNASSSRSHALYMLKVTLSDSEGTATRTSKLSMVDLAGSERASSTGAEGDTLMEGANINRSLTVLGMCLDRLADQSATDGKSSKKALPVPYRDSQLTFLLSESLGGNAKCTMLANISPADVNADETLSTLRFAQVAKRVKSKAVVNESATAKLIRELRTELSGLRSHLHEAQCKRESELALRASLAVSEAAAGRTNEATAEEAPEEDTAAETTELQCAIDEKLVALKAATTSEEGCYPNPNDGDDDYAAYLDNGSIAESSYGEPIDEGAAIDEVRDHGTAAKERPTRSNQDAVYVDWSCPQLVCMNEYVEPTVHAIPAGMCVVHVCSRTAWRVAQYRPTADNSVHRPTLDDDVLIALVVNYAPIDGHVTLVAWTAGDHVAQATVELDGVTVQAVGDAGIKVPLLHNGRMLIRWSDRRKNDKSSSAPPHHDGAAVASLLFRISNVASLPSAPRFSRVVGACETEPSTAATVSHLALLEAFDRLTIAQVLFSELLRTCDKGASASEGQPLVSNEALRELAGLRREAQSERFSVEDRLSQQYPPSAQEIAQHMRTLATASSRRQRTLSACGDREDGPGGGDAAALPLVSLPVRIALMHRSGDDGSDSDEEDSNGERALKMLLEEVDALREATKQREAQQVTEQQQLEERIANSKHERRAREQSMIVHKKNLPPKRLPNKADFESLMDSVAADAAAGIVPLQVVVDESLPLEEADPIPTDSAVDPAPVALVRHGEDDARNTAAVTNDDTESLAHENTVHQDNPASIVSISGSPVLQQDQQCHVEPCGEVSPSTDATIPPRGAGEASTDAVEADSADHDGGVNSAPLRNTNQENVGGDDGDDGPLSEHDTIDATSTIDASRDAATVALELQWHQGVRSAQQPRPTGPMPRDHPLAAEDLGVWTRFATDPKDKLPFLKEILTKQLVYYWGLIAAAPACSTVSDDSQLSPDHDATNQSFADRPSNMSFVASYSSVVAPLSASGNSAGGTPSDHSGFPSIRLLPVEEQRAGYAWKLNQGLQSHKWEYRFLLLSGRFLYYFYSADGTCRCLAALYLYGATCNLLPQTFEGKDFALHLSTTAPRRSKDKATSFYFAFPTAADRCWWVHWIATAAAPPLPPTLRLRLEQEAAASAGAPWNIASAASKPGTSPGWLVPPSKWKHHQPLDQASEAIVPRDPATHDAATPGSRLLREKHIHWAADETAPSCHACLQSFGFFRRRHHCRACGEVFCDACTVTVDMLNERNEMKKKRACKQCVAASISRVGRGSLVETEDGTNNRPTGTATERSGARTNSAQENHSSRSGSVASPCHDLHAV